jgi:hypothetical protein
MTDDDAVGVKLALRDAARNYNRLLVIAAGLGIVSLLVLTVAGKWVAGVMICIGLGLGIVNSLLVQRSLATAIIAGDPNKRGLAMGVLKRLSVTSLVAFVIALAYQPYGWLVFLGLAAFQLLIMATVFSGLVREVRRS